MRIPRFEFATVLILGLLATTLHAGVYIQGTSRSSDHPGDVINQKVYVEADRMRVEVSGRDSDMITIFRMDKEAFLIIDRERGTYTEITRQELAELNAEMEKARQSFEEQMKNMPPEQQAMMQTMMKDTMPEKAPDINYKKIASDEKVHQWKCDKYEAISEGEKVMDIWTADWKSLGFQPEQFKVMVEMGRFFEDFAKDSTPFFLGVNVEGADEEKQAEILSGLPIKTVTYSGDQATNTTEVTEIKEQDFEASLFDLPAGLKKERMPRQGP